MKRVILSLISVLVPLLISVTNAHAQFKFPDYPEPDLPVMGACLHDSPQPLPEQWQATVLMAPYLYTGKPTDLRDLSSRAELQVGRFVYDAKNQVMRATRYGVKRGGVIDLLISDRATWVLTVNYKKPECVGTLAAPYKLPSRIWQDSKYQPVCVGSHSTAPTIDTGPNVDWWKQKSPLMEPGAQGDAADWFWFDQNGYPTRTMFWYKHDGLPAILGDYAFTTFYQFGPGNDIDLKEILTSCERTTLPVWNEKKLLELEKKTEAAQSNAVAALIPGLSYRACVALNAKPPTWPVEIYISSFSTAAKYSTPKPLATSVYYRPNGPELRTRLHKDGDAGPYWSDALLIDHDSYGVNTYETPPYNLKNCARGPYTSLPGSPHANWGAVGQCQCMAVIENNPVLSPGRKTEISGCPLPLIATEPGQQSGNTIFWMWYALNPMRPVVFLQSKPDVTIGTGLSLADYAHWQQTAVPDDIFTTPVLTSCPAPPKSDPVAPAPCMGCHNRSTNQ
jgi:hypothetical protein